VLTRFECCELRQLHFGVGETSGRATSSLRPARRHPWRCSQGSVLNGCNSRDQRGRGLGARR
jgi:hypothetical protein